MSLSITDNRLLYLLRLAIAGKWEDCALFSGMLDADWNSVLELSQKQGVCAVAFDGIEMLPAEYRPSLNILMDWLGRASIIESKYTHQLEDSATLANLWKENSIRTLVIKGHALSRYYPVPSHREFGDFDCYLFGKYDDGNRVAEQAGCKVDTDWYKHSQIHFKTIIAENHKYFTQCRKGKKERSINKELVNYLGDGSFLKTIIDTNLLLPPLCFEGLFMVYHASSHFLLEGLSLRHFCDWACWMNANQNKISWTAFYSQCQQYQFDRFVDAMNAITTEYFGLKITNNDIVINNTYAERVLENTLNEGSKIFNKGGKWYSRYAVILNAFRYSWKYREIAQNSLMEFIWSYVKGFVFRQEEAQVTQVSKNNE